MMSKVRSVLAWAAWPVLFAGCLAVTGYGFAHDHLLLYFNLSYFALALALLALERFMPHASEWNKYDGQILPDIAHTLTSKGVVQGLFGFSAVIGIADYVTTLDMPGYGIWPCDWPLWAQVPLGVVAAEFGLYWAHRLAHEWKPLWFFHAVHHSVERLWVVNTGRFHFVDSLVSIVFGLAVLLVLGAPMEVVEWLSVITAFIGLLTHCNVAMRFGPISWIFNTPGLHRWHHSKDLREGNRNYSENVMLWDIIFGTYINPGHRPPVDIGINDDMPASFFQQILWPFRRNRLIFQQKTENS